jgi:hypothetical protein
MNTIVDSTLSGSIVISGSIIDVSGPDISSPNGFMLRGDNTNTVTIYMYGVGGTKSSGYTFDAYSDNQMFSTANNLKYFKFGVLSGNGVIRWVKV